MYFIYIICGSYVSMVSPTDLEQALSRHLVVHLRSTRALASHFWDCDLMAWKLRPKHHYLLHLSQDVVRNKLNPRIYHCFGAEGWLGTAKSVARMCHGKSMTHRFLQRYILGMAEFLKNSSQ